MEFNSDRLGQAPKETKPHEAEEVAELADQFAAQAVRAVLRHDPANVLEALAKKLSR